MTLLRYIGPHDGVRLPLPKRPDVAVARGETVEVPDSYAGSLLDQPDNWEAVEPPKPKPASKAVDEKKESENGG